MKMKFKTVNSFLTINCLTNYYSLKFLRRTFSSDFLTGHERSGGVTFFLILRNTTFFTVGGSLLRRSKKRHNLNQSITFLCRVSKNRFAITCPVQFNIGIAV